MRCLTSARFNMLADVYNQVVRQDPDSGEFRKSYVVAKVGIPCFAHGIMQGGIRVAGTTERFSEIYENVDWANIRFGIGEPVNKESQIRNLRDLKGNIIWREEEMVGAPPTIFDVQGVIPVVDPFGRHSENSALLQRHEIQ